MKFHHVSACLLFAMLALPGFADTLILKDGSKLEGTIVRKDATQYVVEVQFTKGIKDERVIAKADVVKIIQEEPALAAFETISKFVPTPDCLTAAQYAQRIQAVEKFLEANTGSSKSKEAKEMLAQLKAESKEIVAGGVKLDGKIVSHAEYHANMYEVDARIQAARIKRAVDDSRYLDALREFQKFEQEYKNTTKYDEMVGLIKRVITVYTTGVSQTLATIDERIAKRNAGLEQMAPSDRAAASSAISAEDAALATRFQTEKDAKIGWVTPHPFCKAALTETMNFSKQELARLNAPKKAIGTGNGGKAYRDALALIEGSGSQADVTAAMNLVKTLGIPARYVENLQIAAKAKGLKP